MLFTTLKLESIYDRQCSLVVLYATKNEHGYRYPCTSLFSFEELACTEAYFRQPIKLMPGC